MLHDNMDGLKNVSKPAGIYFLKRNNGNNRRWYEICSQKFTLKTPE